MANQELIVKSLELEIYSPFKAQLEEQKEKNKHLIFSYNSEKEIKEVKKYIAELRRSKAPITDAHKLGKAESLQYGRMIDAGKNYLINEIEAMIDVHEKPLKDLKEREDSQHAVIAEIRNILMNAMTSANPQTSAQLLQEIERVKKYNFSGFGDNEEIAMGAKAKTLEGLAKLHRHTLDAEKEEAEKAEKDKAEMMEQMQKEADAKAQAKASYDIQAAKETAAMEITRAAARVEAEKQREAAAEEKRLKDVEYTGSVHRGIVEALVISGIDEETAKNVVRLAHKKEAGNLFIKY